MGLKMHCSECDRVIDPLEAKFTLKMMLGVEVTPGTMKSRNANLDICYNCVSEVRFLVPHYVEQLRAGDLTDLFFTYSPVVAKKMGIRCRATAV